MTINMGSCGNTILRESMIIDDQDKHEEISFEVCLGNLIDKEFHYLCFFISELNLLESN